MLGNSAVGSFRVGSRIEPASSSTNYTFTLAAGSYAGTGTAATLLASRRLTAASGTYGVTGVATSGRRALMLRMTAGAYAITGSAASFVKSIRFVLAAGTYALTGTANSSRRALLLSVQSGVYSLIGRLLNLIPSGGSSPPAAYSARITITPRFSATFRIYPQ